MTNYDFNVSNSNPQDRELTYESGKEMNFNFRQERRKSNTDKSMIKLFKSPAIMASAISTKILSANPDGLCRRLKLLLPENHAGENLNKIDEEFVVIDKLLEYKCISKKQNKQKSIKCNLLHE